MLLDARTLRGIQDGTVTLAFRRWTVPRVRVGTRQRTRVGVVEVTSVDRAAPAGSSTTRTALPAASNVRSVTTPAFSVRISLPAPS